MADAIKAMTVGEFKAWIEQHGVGDNVDLYVEVQDQGDGVGAYEVPCPGITVQATSTGYTRVVIHSET